MKELTNDDLVAAKESGRIAVKNHEERCMAVLKTLKTRRHIFRKSAGLIQYLTLIDAVGFYVVYDLDITSLRFQVLYAETSWQKNLSARLLAMTLWECVDDLPQVCGPAFRKAVADLTFTDELRGKLDKTMKEINSFKHRNEALLKPIRDNVAAHRDKDLDKFFDGLEHANPKLLVDIAKSLCLLLGDFSSTMNDALREAKQLTKFTRMITTLKAS